jgi:hypothetical protein
VSDMINEFWAEEDTRDREPTGAETLEPTASDDINICIAECLAVLACEDYHWSNYLTDAKILRDHLANENLTITPAEVAASDGVTVSRKVLRVLIDAAEPKGMVTTGPQTQRIRLAIQTAQSALRSSAPATTARDERTP